jgi:hypothetical protein
MFQTRISRHLDSFLLILTPSEFFLWAVNSQRMCKFSLEVTSASENKKVGTFFRWLVCF